VTKLREILQFVAERPSRIVPFPELRHYFHGDLTGLRIALERNLLELRYSCYALTTAGLEFLASTVLAAISEKICYQCQRTLPIEQFWKNANSGDGAFDYCIACGNRRKRKAMEARYQAARDRVIEASIPVVLAARRWDAAAAELAAAWTAIMAADQVIREASHDLQNNNDSGRLHARTTFPRAAFALNIALADVKFPQVAPLLREVDFPTRLADYIGQEPFLDYCKQENREDGRPERHEAAEHGQGPEIRGAEPDQQGTARDGTGRPRKRGRPRLPRGTGQEVETGGVPAPGGPVLAA
jgi:hypothetical protein